MHPKSRRQRSSPDIAEDTTFLVIFAQAALVTSGSQRKKRDGKSKERAAPPAPARDAATVMKRQPQPAPNRAPLFLLTLVGLVLIGGGGLCWMQFRNRTTIILEPASNSVNLSDSTRRILDELSAPLEIRFFAPGETSVVPEYLRGYIGRVANLLAEYEQAAAGKLRVQQSDPQTNPPARTAAQAAGLNPFTTETGELIYLGLTVGTSTQIETIAPLAPEWEAALESDLSRAIQRVATKLATARPPRPANRAAVQAAPVDPAVNAQLLKLFPDLKTRPYDDMAQELRLATLEEFKVATAELQSKLSAAQQTLADAQASQSAAEQAAASKNFQQVQVEQTEKLKAITAWLQERLTALQQLKSAPELSAAPR